MAAMASCTKHIQRSSPTHRSRRE